MARNLLSSDITECDEDDLQEIFKILQEQQEELASAKDTGDGGWRCVCHKIQSCVFAAIKQTVRIFFMCSIIHFYIYLLPGCRRLTSI